MPRYGPIPSRTSDKKKFAPSSARSERPLTGLPPVAPNCGLPLIRPPASVVGKRSRARASAILLHPFVCTTPESEKRGSKSHALDRRVETAPTEAYMRHAAKGRTLAE
jgi:hypothetical protein